MEGGRPRLQSRKRGRGLTLVTGRKSQLSSSGSLEDHTQYRITDIYRAWSTRMRENSRLQSVNPYFFMASSSSLSSGPMKHQVFLSFRGEDTRLNFTSHLLEALKATGMNVFFDEEKLEKGEQLSQALSQAIAASSLSLIVLSNDYASSKSCLAELFDIMDYKDTRGHIVLPIFYHVDPSDVRNLGGGFKKSFEHHELKGLDQVHRWKVAFSGVGKLK
ncbi:TMV resistance protein N-like [Hibiscus syriacus]|uniref:TMV resistance protein N-like n=1 Tax=Hibiscus syriacus TaxID=106335 RepID=UPI0019206D47|nr:TMV resistance protein N-like [Hibiscus syriacus]